MKSKQKPKLLEAPPFQSGYVQKVLAEEPALHYVIKANIKRIKLMRHTVEFSPFAELVAAMLIEQGIDPHKSKKLIVRKAMEIIQPKLVERTRVIHLGKPDGKNRYVEHLKGQVKKQDEIIRRALAQKTHLLTKIEKLTK